MTEVMHPISLVGELKIDVEIKSSAKMFYQMLAGRPHDIPKASPDHIPGCDLLEGELGEVGSVTLWNCVIDGQPQVSKEMIEAADPEENLLVFKIIEGDVLKEFKSFLTTVQATQKEGEPGSVVKCHLKYERIHENVPHPEDVLATCVNMYKDMDEMLSSEA